MKPIALALMLALSACATTPETTAEKPSPVVETGKQTLGVLGYIGLIVILPLALIGAF